MSSEEEFVGKVINKKLDYFEYDRLISLDFGSTWTKFAYYDIRNEQLVLDDKRACSYHPSACLYICKNNDYDNARFRQWGEEAAFKKRNIVNALYIDKLRDKMEDLCKVEPDVKVPLQNAKDRLYFRAIIQYFQKLIEYIINFINMRDSRSDSSKNRYVITYPSNWDPKKVSYLRSLAQIAGIVSDQDHPDRLIMYSEGASILRYLQEPQRNENIKQGYKYLICDLGGSKVKMNLYEIKEPLDTGDTMKGERLCNWDIHYMEKPSELNIGAQDIIKESELYILYNLSTTSNVFTLEDVDEEDGCLFDRRKLFEQLASDIYKNSIKAFSSETVARKDTTYHNIPFLLQEQELKDIIPKKSIHSNSTESSFERYETLKKKPKETPNKVGSELLVVHHDELEKKVFKPICKQIIQYLEHVLQRAKSSIDSVILTGGFCRLTYLMDLVVDTCRRLDINYLIPFKQNESAFNSYEIVCGAIMKSMDKVRAQNPTPRIVFDTDDLSSHSEKTEMQETFIFIDYGLKRTRASYIHVEPGQYPHSANIKHIVSWPGQYEHIDFPTIDVMLIPRDQQNGNSKRIISLKDNADHNAQFLRHAQNKRTEYKYYTFEKDQHGIIFVTHVNEEEKVENESKRIVHHASIEDLQIANQELNVCADRKEIDTVKLINAPLSRRGSFGRTQSTPIYTKNYKLNVTKQRITTQEFTLLYFDYLTTFLHEHIHSKTGAQGGRFQFCITRDNQADPNGLRLSDEDIYKVAKAFGMLSKRSDPIYKRVLVLERAEATAIYCREKVDDSHLDESEAHLHFMQVQLYPNQCVTLVNRVPFLNDKEYDNTRLNDEAWNSMYKCMKSKYIPFNAMNIISESLWAHIQLHQHSKLKKCRRHRSSKRFFNSSNMKVFKQMLKDYISTMFLDIENGEKMHTFYICNNGLENCCRVCITNMDLMEFGIVPAINGIVSIVEGSISHHYQYRKIQISDIFVMGEFFACRDYTSYKFLEGRLLMKLRKINFRRLDTNLLRSMTKSTEVTKINISKLDGEHADDDNSDDEQQDSLAQISEMGSIMYSLGPRNRLIERFASRAYAIRIQVFEPSGRVLNKKNDDESVCVVYEHLNNLIKATDEELIPIIIKGTRLASIASTGEEIGKLFMITNILQDHKISIGLFTSDDDSSSISYVIGPNSKFDHIQNFVIENCTHSTFPVIFKTRISQTKAYKFWVVHEWEKKIPHINIRENILLKPYYSEQDYLAKNDSIENNKFI